MIIMKESCRIILPALLVIFFGCSKNGITPPPISQDADLVGTKPLTDTVMKHMEGIYDLSAGSDGLGSNFVCKVSKFRVSFFSNANGIFFILKYGLNPTDSSLQFAGFWRYSETTAQGLVNFSIPKDKGVLAFLQSGDPSGLELGGLFANAAGGGANNLSLKYTRDFTNYAKTHPFQIYAHHGVQTTANPPYAENSINGALHDEDYGVNSLEFDVHLTKDGVPICMHDAEIDIDLTKKSALAGKYIQYSFAFLQNYLQLVDGQKIPSVEEVLT